MPDVKPKPGRPATGKDPYIGVRLPPELVADLDAFAARHGINRSEAVRQALIALVRLGGLAPEKTPAKPPAPVPAPEVAAKPLKASPARSVGPVDALTGKPLDARPRSNPKAGKK